MTQSCRRAADLHLHPPTAVLTVLLQEGDVRLVRLQALTPPSLKDTHPSHAITVLATSEGSCAGNLNMYRHLENVFILIRSLKVDVAS